MIFITDREDSDCYMYSIPVRSLLWTFFDDADMMEIYGNVNVGWLTQLTRLGPINPLVKNRSVINDV